jgi:hypothetical protein
MTLAAEYASAAQLAPPAARQLVAGWQARAANAFNPGGLCGALAAIPRAGFVGRRQLFMTYFLFAAAAIGAPFGLALAPALRLNLLFLVGAGVCGVFGVLTSDLPELFPARLRASGAGFCYNIGRIFAATGPFIVATISARAGGSSSALTAILCWVALAPSRRHCSRPAGSSRLAARLWPSSEPVRGRARAPARCSRSR